MTFNDYILKDIVSILITLYAIVPSIVITVMYSFLSSIEKELSDNWREFSQLDNKKKIKRDKIDRFVVVSSKIFHVSMGYYLIQLAASLISECLKLENDLFLLIPRISTGICMIYFFLYFWGDISRSLSLLFLGKENQNKWGFLGISLYLITLYGILPLAGLVYYLGQNEKEIHWHLIWISITILHLVLWWLIIPFIYKPLTNLSLLKRKCLN